MLYTLFTEMIHKDPFGRNTVNLWTTSGKTDFWELRLESLDRNWIDGKEAGRIV